ncbi:mannitol dehydrogenase family protein, partial [Burkholderia sp. SIMBA_024]
IRRELETVWREEVLPVFAANGLGDQAAAYVDSVRERFLNPFLKHRIADIASNHEEKKLRRFAPVIDRASELGLDLEQPRLKAA